MMSEHQFEKERGAFPLVAAFNDNPSNPPKLLRGEGDGLLVPHQGLMMSKVSITFWMERGARPPPETLDDDLRNPNLVRLR